MPAATSRTPRTARVRIMPVVPVGAATSTARQFLRPGPPSSSVGRRIWPAPQQSSSTWNICTGLPCDLSCLYVPEKGELTVGPKEQIECRPKTEGFHAWKPELMMSRALSTGKVAHHWKRGLCSNRRLGRKMRERVRSSGASQRGGHMPGGRTFDPPSSAHEVPVARELRTRVDRPRPSGRNALLEEPGIVEGDL